MIDETGCHAVMVARGAMKTPWMAGQIKQKISPFGDNIHEMEFKNPDYLRTEIKQYFSHLKIAYEGKNLVSSQILKQFKNLARYIFDDLPGGPEIRQKFLLSQNLNENEEWYSLQ